MESFKEKTSLDSDGCWIWTGALGSDGYGRASHNGATVLAHRLSYIKYKGFIDPPSMLVLHTCDKPACVNPEHLFLGTQQDNVNDMVSKGRAKFPTAGESNHRSLLSDAEFEDVIAWIDLDVPLRWIANEYGLSLRTVQSYKHLRARSAKSGVVGGGQIQGKDSFGL